MTTSVNELTTGALVAPAFSEEALALKFAERYATFVRYVAAWGKWMFWDGKVWRRDETLRAFELARVICREAAAQAEDRGLKAIVASAKTVAAVERLAKADRRLAATADQWDIGPMLLNTPEGVIDLETGEMRAHRPEDYITRITACAPGGSCPRFQKFLARITNHDPEMIAFLARVFGYALTGLTIEHAMFFFHGKGRNGKSVLLLTVSKILGDYAKSVPVEAFVASRGDRIPNDIAGMRGARLVTSVETEKGQTWAESRIKRLTGGEGVDARFMRGEWFTFTPTFKIIIGGNNKPSLANVDEAMRARINIVPFDVFIPPEERDQKLADTLQEEAPGILAWMVRGCADWLQLGLAPPKVVRAATDEYLVSEDSIAAWVADCLEPDPEGWLSSTDLYGSWKAWAIRNGDAPGTQKALSMILKERKWRKDDRRQGRGFAGLRFRSDGQA